MGIEGLRIAALAGEKDEAKKYHKIADMASDWEKRAKADDRIETVLEKEKRWSLNNLIWDKLCGRADCFLDRGV